MVNIPESELVPAWQPLGDALLDYNAGNYMAHIIVKSSVETDRNVPLEAFYRGKKFPPLESNALRRCRGKVLDAGAGAGAHAIWLQDKGLEVMAIDVSQGAVDVMRKRGVKKTKCISLFEYQEGGWDTILMLMNGIGVAGDLPGLHHLLSQLRNLLNRGGQIIFDSTDISYVEEQSMQEASLPAPKGQYYGVVHYQLEYKGKRGKPYTWLFADENLIMEAAVATGLSCRIIYKAQEQHLYILEKK